MNTGRHRVFPCTGAAQTAKERVSSGDQTGEEWGKDGEGSRKRIESAGRRRFLAPATGTVEEGAERKKKEDAAKRFQV